MSISAFAVRQSGMRFIVMHKVTEEMETGAHPSPALIARMGAFLGELSMTGRFLAGEGLKPSATRTRLGFAGSARTVLRGPYAGANELVAECLLIRVASHEEAIDWASRLGAALGDVELEVGPVNEPWDLGFAPKPDGAPLRYLVVRKADARSEAGLAPAPAAKVRAAEVTARMRDAGVLDLVERLEPSAAGKRVLFIGSRRLVVDGPFPESKELIAGFSILSLTSMAEALEQTTRFAAALGHDVEVDVRPLVED